MSSDASSDIGAEVTIEPEEGSEAPKAKRCRGGRYNKDRSAIWDHFDYDKEEERSKCRHCSFSTSDKTPANLKKHLKKHPGALSDVEKKTEEKRKNITAVSMKSTSPTMIQSKISTLFERAKPYDKNGIKYQQLVDALALFFASIAAFNRRVAGVPLFSINARSSI